MKWICSLIFAVCGLGCAHTTSGLRGPAGDGTHVHESSMTELGKIKNIQCNSQDNTVRACSVEFYTKEAGARPQSFYSNYESGLFLKTQIDARKLGCTPYNEPDCDSAAVYFSRDNQLEAADLPWLGLFLF